MPYVAPAEVSIFLRVFLVLTRPVQGTLLTATSCPQSDTTLFFHDEEKTISKVKMAATGARTMPSKAKKATGPLKRAIPKPKTAASGIKHQVILPKGASSKAKSRKSAPGASALPKSSSVVKMKTVSRPGRVSKRNGVWYLGGNHVVKLLTSVEGDLDHTMLAKLEAVPTVVGELALSVESLVSDDFTVGGFEKDILAKITSNTLTAKRGVVAAANPAATPTPLSVPVTVDQTKKYDPSPATKETKTASTPTPAGEGQVPNPLLANYEPVPNPLAIRITPPASPHANSAEQKPAAIDVSKTRRDPPMIQAR